jgi:hypothetical protein
MIAAEERMARVEGAVRMKRVGLFMILGGLTSTVLGAFTLFLQRYWMIGHAFYVPMLLPGLALVMMTYLGIFPMIVGGCLWASGWIVEGFLDQRDQSSSS